MMADHFRFRTNWDTAANGKPQHRVIKATQTCDVGDTCDVWASPPSAESRKRRSGVTFGKLWRDFITLAVKEISRDKDPLGKLEAACLGGSG